MLFIILLINGTVSKGQIYKYIGLEDGLNNQKIYHIQKDRRGYMWFLTQEGVDRYDGKHIKHYTFFRQQHEVGLADCLELALYGQKG